MNNFEDTLDFVYLLELMPVLHDMPEYSILPKLLSIIGFKALVDVCDAIGGSDIHLPTVDEIYHSIVALQWYYDINIKQTKSRKLLPERYKSLYEKIDFRFNTIK